jgi:hypothetical protein
MGTYFPIGKIRISSTTQSRITETQSGHLPIAETTVQMNAAATRNPITVSMEKLLSG